MSRRFHGPLLGVLLALGACAQGGEHASHEPTHRDDAAHWLAQVRSAHLRADAALASDDTATASAALREMIAAEVPAQLALAHRRALLHDLHYRLSSLELGRGDAMAALAAADGGLLHGRVADVFTANLYIARGAALEALGRDTEAAASYYEALEINRALLAHVLAAPDAGIAP